LWWDAFATEFFEDDASLTLSFSMEDGPKRYSKLHVACLMVLSLAMIVRIIFT
jgi:LIM-domain binding protein